MFDPIDILYTDNVSVEEQAFQLKQIRRRAEINRAKVMAKIVLQQKERLRKQYKNEIQDVATETKSSLTAIRNQVEKAIQGKCQEAIEGVIDDYLELYDTIV
ncbi:hypothetical protein ACVRYP_08400 [Streptococcus rifensis]